MTKLNVYKVPTLPARGTILLVWSVKHKAYATTEKVIDKWVCIGDFGDQEFGKELYHEAVDKYERLLKRERLYSASIVLTLQSTDYTCP